MTCAARFHLPQRYYVFIGHRDGHKNAALVFDALASMPETAGIGLLCVGGAPDLELWLAEKAGDATVRVARLTDEDVEGRVLGSRPRCFTPRATKASGCRCSKRWPVAAR